MMKSGLRSTLFWMPRIAAIMFILFLSIFALDVFDMNLGFWGTIAGLLIHLIPSIVLTITLILAWRWEWVGALAFLGWAVWYMTSARGFPWSVYVIVAGIPTLIGLLFLVNWVLRRQVHSDSVKPA